MAVSRKAKAIYNGFFEGIETFVANRISDIQTLLELKKYAPKEKIPKDYAKAYKAYWKKFGLHVSPMWGWYFASRNGNMDVRYVPITLSYTKIDQHFNSRKLGYGFNDKNYYSKIFDGIKQPKILVRKINKFLFDENFKQISAETAFNLIKSEKEVICKPAQESGSGRSIFFIKNDEDAIINDFLVNNEYDNFIVQAIVKQHPDLAAIHESSINCIRVCSILLEDGVHILSSVLRMGFGESRIDNATSKDNQECDGMSCGIDENGKLKKYAYGRNYGVARDRYPNGIIFEGYQIPSYDKVIELVKDCHQRIGNFRLVSWDISVDEDGDAVLIESNMRKGGVNTHQFNNGPIFGDMTDKIIGEVFNKKKRK